LSDGKPLYNIFAGVNGAGKTSLYSVIKDNDELGYRVNIDEMVARHGSWRDTLLQIKSARSAIELVDEYIERRVSFHQETTLPGVTIVKQIKKAKEAGYAIRLLFVGLDSVETAIERVHKRVEKGGHGIDDEVIRRRFAKMPETLLEILPLCDMAIFFDNTVKFREIAIFKNNVLIDIDEDIPDWFSELLTLSSNNNISETE